MSGRASRRTDHNIWSLSRKCPEGPFQRCNSCSCNVCTTPARTAQGVDLEYHLIDRRPRPRIFTVCASRSYLDTLHSPKRSDCASRLELFTSQPIREWSQDTFVVLFLTPRPYSITGQMWHLAGVASRIDSHIGFGAICRGLRVQGKRVSWWLVTVVGDLPSTWQTRTL